MANETEDKECKACDGSGEVEETCSGCNGRGVEDVECDECDGTGEVQEDDDADA